MKIFVVNGSPKAQLSVTLQYVRFLAKHCPQHSFVEFHLADELRRLEKKPEALQTLKGDMESADAILWAFPVYYFLVPAGLKRLIELLSQDGDWRGLENKAASALSTSIHFFDHTAHAYMRAVSEDLGMRVLPGYSARMEDLMKPGARQSLLAYMEELRGLAENPAMRVPRAFAPVKYRKHRNSPKGTGKPGPGVPGKILLVTDNGSERLKAMQEVVCARLGTSVERVELDRMRIDSACIGCLRCGWSGQCVFKDDMAAAWERILAADALIFAGVTKDRFLSSRWKTFLDRSFFHGHRPVLTGRRALWLIDGPIEQLSTLRQVLEGHASVAGLQLLDLVDGDQASGSRLGKLLEACADRLVHSMRSGMRRPRLFPGVGGLKVFRDFVYLSSFLFQADHRYYRQHGIYDFSQKDWRARMFNAAMSGAMHLPPFRRKVFKDMRELMLRPYRRTVERT